MKIISLPELIDSNTKWAARNHEYYIETYTLNTNGVHDLAKHALVLRAQLIEANARINALVDALKELQSTTKENA